jgi:hypothetical protein
MLKLPPQGQESGIFLTDLSTLNKLYQFTKAFLEKPSLTTRMSLQGAIEEAEKTYFLQPESLLGAAKARAREDLPRQFWSKRLLSKRSFSRR